MKSLKVFLDRILFILYNTVNEKPFLTSAIYVGFFFGIVVLGYLPIGFNTNDDISMMLTSKGLGYFNQPSSLVTFSNIIYGHYLSYFSVAFPQINFYTLNNCLLIVSSEILIVYLILKSSEKFGLKLMFLMTNIFFMMVVFTKLQFTITCSIVFVAGVISLLYGLIKKSSLFFYLGVVFCIVGTLIRFKQTVVILALLAPLLFILIKPLEKKLIIKIALSFCAVLVIGASLFAYNNYAYKHIYKTEFLSSSKKMAILFYDYLSLQRSSEASRTAFMKKHKLTENDILIYEKFFWTPGSFFNPETVTDDDVSIIQSSVRGPLVPTQKSLYAFFDKFFLIAIALLFFTVYIVASNRKESINYLLLGVAFIFYFALMSQIFNWYFKPMPFRVLFSLFLSIHFIVFFLLSSSKNAFTDSLFNSKFQRYFIIAITSLLTFYLLFVFARGFIKQVNFFYTTNLVFVLMFLVLFLHIVFVRNSNNKLILTAGLFFSFSMYQILTGPVNLSKKYLTCQEKLGALDTTINYFPYTSSLHLETIEPFDNFLAISKYKLFPISIISNHPVVLGLNKRFKNDFYNFNPYQNA